METGGNSNYLKAGTGPRSWLASLDHKRIGLMYLIVLCFVFIIGGYAALTLRMDISSPGGGADPGGYRQAISLHALLLFFLFMMPAIPASLGNFILPLQIGASNMAFPRLNRAGLYLWIISLLLFATGGAAGGLQHDWSFTVPGSLSHGVAVVFAGLAVPLLSLVLLFTGINFLVTIHTLRAPRMTMFRMPLTVWGIYAGAVIQVAAAPVMGMTFILLLLERIMGVGIFDPAKGGDAVLYQHFFWFFAHPSLFMALLPGFGIVSDIISTFSGKKPFGYAWLAVSFLAVALLSFMSWGNHIPASAQSAEASTVFAFFAWMTAVPVILCMVHWTATMYKGVVRLQTPMVYALIFMFLFAAGGLMGGILALPSLNAYLRDTYFTVAHLHYLVLGGTVMAFFAGVHYWWPKITGKIYNELWARLIALVILIGFNMAFLPQLVLGVQGVPKRFYGQLPEFTLYHQLSTLGGLILGAGLVAVLVNLLVSLKKGEGASQNPWGSEGLEWTAAGSPLRIRTNLPHDLKLREKRMSQKRRRFNGR